MNNIITITGASGFVGQNLSKYLLEREYKVLPVSLRSGSFNFDSQSLSLVHLAGKAHDTKKKFGEAGYFEVNTELTKKVFDQFMKSEIRDFFFFSSVKATADVVEGVLTEEHISNPTSPYGRSKLESEHYLLSQDLPKDKRLFIIRPCMIHGPGNKGNLNLLFQMVKRGIPWPLAAFENKRSYLSIENLNFLMVKMIEHADIPSGIYNFADDQVLSTNQVVEIMNETLGKKNKLWKIPKSLMINLAKFGDRFSLPLNTERLEKLTENYEVSNLKIKNALHISQLPVESKLGLKKTIKSFLK